MPNTPLETVKERFKDKAALVKAVEGLAKGDLWLDRLNPDTGFDSISNKKLVHLHDVLSAVKDEFGSRAKLIEAIATAVGQPKDADYKTSLERHPTPKLYAIYRAAAKRAK